MRCGPGSPWMRHDDSCEMEAADLGRRPADRTLGAEIQRSGTGGRGDHRRSPQAQLVGARRLPLRSAGDDPAPVDLRRLGLCVFRSTALLQDRPAALESLARSGCALETDQCAADTADSFVHA